jgi:hypothetical protein
VNLDGNIWRSRTPFANSGIHIRHFADDRQIRENRTTGPPPRELHPIRSHPMT